MLRKGFLAGAVFAAGMIAAPAVAHHGWSGYSDDAITVTGTVQRVAWQNPHALLTLESEGKVWEVVLAPISRMSSRGLPEGTLKEGQTVTVQGYPHERQAAEMRAETITVDGKAVPLR